MPDDEDQIGYGKPPRAKQFRKGQSGNPKGRPKGSVNAATIFQRLSRQPVTVKEGGTTRQVPKIEVVLAQLLNKAAGGDQRAIREVLSYDRLYEVREEGNQERGPDQEKDDAVLQRLRARMERTDHNQTEEDHGNS